MPLFMLFSAYEKTLLAFNCQAHCQLNLPRILPSSLPSASTAPYTYPHYISYHSTLKSSICVCLPATVRFQRARNTSYSPTRTWHSSPYILNSLPTPPDSLLTLSFAHPSTGSSHLDNPTRDTVYTSHDSQCRLGFKPQAPLTPVCMVLDKMTSGVIIGKVECCSLT